MFSYRVTKYNPKYRNLSGAFLRDDWTSISDVGKIYNGKKLTVEEYLKIENAYIEAVMLFMNFLKIKYLNFMGLKLSLIESPVKSTKAMVDIYDSVYSGIELDKSKIADTIRLLLRKNLGGRLEGEGMFVHFGYDYYMYIGSAHPSSQSLIHGIKEQGLFVEEFESPYLQFINQEED